MAVFAASPMNNSLRVYSTSFCQAQVSFTGLRISSNGRDFMW